MLQVDVFEAQGLKRLYPFGDLNTRQINSDKNRLPGKEQAMGIRFPPAAQPNFRMRQPSIGAGRRPSNAEVACVFALALLAAQVITGRAVTQPLRAGAQGPDDRKEPIEKFMNTFTEPIRIGESKPVTVNGAKFVLVAQTDWKPGKPDKVFPMVAPIEIQLHITNLSKNDVIFPTFETFGVKISNADGEEVRPLRLRKGGNVTSPVLIPAGASYSLCPRGELRWDEKTKASELIYFDGAGSQSVIGPLEPGRYKLVFWYSVSPENGEKQKIGHGATWLGEAITKEVVVEVLDSTTRGYLPANDQSPGGFTEPIRIRNSKPVRVNDASFVVVAQADWKPRKYGAVLIETQLRITNFSKSDLIFPTFDAFHVRILDGDGNAMIPRGGRKLTKVTRPVLIPAGASYSLAAQRGAPSGVHRRAELHWDLKSKASELRYYDGTGWVSILGPLERARYKLAFGYGVSGEGPFKSERDPATWLGKAVTDNLLIELLAP